MNYDTKSLILSPKEEPLCTFRLKKLALECRSKIRKIISSFCLERNKAMSNVFNFDRTDLDSFNLETKAVNYLGDVKCIVYFN